MTRAYTDYLHDILEVSTKAQTFVEGIDFASKVIGQMLADLE